MTRKFTLAMVCSLSVLLSTCSRVPEYDVVIRGGTVYDGTGKYPVTADVAIKGNRDRKSVV